jgi:hypothetical protein
VSSHRRNAADHIARDLGDVRDADIAQL